MHASQVKKDDDVTEEIQTFYSTSDVKVAILSKKKKLKILSNMMAYFVVALVCRNLCLYYGGIGIFLKSVQYNGEIGITN